MKNTFTIIVNILSLLLGLWVLLDSAYTLCKGTDIVDTVVNWVFVLIGIGLVGYTIFDLIRTHNGKTTSK
ncbi:hypothetical protein [Lentilactobacillus otakiensis]|uniref:hypothetical protein n=1 Tax=Lentilactobacillus otakiensis TaxID=481720 RepID=UPI003D184565